MNLSKKIIMSVASMIMMLPVVTVAQTPTPINADRWITTDAYIFNDVNLTARKATISKGTQVHVTTKYVFPNGKQAAQISQVAQISQGGYVDANYLTATVPYTTQSINANRWINADNVSAYSDNNLTNRVVSLNKGTQVYVTNKYIFSNKQVAQIQVAQIKGCVDANYLTNVDPNATTTENRHMGSCDGNNGTYAIYFDNRTSYAPQKSVTTGVNGGFSLDNFNISANYSSTKVQIKGILIPKGVAVTVFPNVNKSLPERFNEENVSVGGKSVPNKKNTKVFSNVNEECILIGYDNMWWYVPRRCLVP